MPRSLLAPSVAALALTLLLHAAPAAAAPVRPAHGPARQGLVRQDLLSFVWSALGRLWGKAGASLDPSGQPHPGQPSDSGGSLDPSGAAGDEGGSLDPNGVK